MMDSIDFGFTSMATGYRLATWRRFIAFPLTSRIQCLPCR